RDADAVPGEAGVVRARRGAEAVDDPAFDGPIELAEIGGRDRGRRGGRAARLGVAAGALERGDPVVEGLFVALQLREPLPRLARAAARGPQGRLALVLERDVACQLLGALRLAAGEGV